jgi:hypothetical protein
MNRITLAVLGTFIVVLIGSGILAYVLRDQSRPAVTTTATPSPGAETKSATPSPSQKIPLIGELFGPDVSGLSPASIESWESTSARIALRFSLAAFLAAILAFRPRRGVSVLRINPYVADFDGGGCGRDDDGCW